LTANGDAAGGPAAADGPEPDREPDDGTVDEPCDEPGDEPGGEPGGEPGDETAPPEGLGEDPSRPHELRLDLPCAHSASRMGRQVLRRFAERRGLPEDELGTLEFVTSELLSNAVDHGGGEAAMDEADLAHDARMQLVFVLHEKAWQLSVSDQGGGDPQELRPFLASDELPDLEDERGRGFYLMARMVEELAVERSADGRGLVFVARNSWT
jgi:anti-sigma regulatory factor (Ser/Thr protein kinase)